MAVATKEEDLLALLARRALGQVPDKRQKVAALHVRLKRRRNAQAVGRLPVFHETAQRTLRGTQRAVEHVAVLFLRITLFLHAAAHFEAPTLVVRAV